MKHSLLCVIIFLATFRLSAQPIIHSFSPVEGPVGTTVTISGTGFGATSSSNIVFFGAIRATVISASASSLTVQVPVGATYQPITVTSNYLTGYSAKPFLVTFPGGVAFPGSDHSDYFFDAPIDSTTGLHPNDVAMADFDGDGKLDMATANNYSITGLPASVSILRNTGSAKKISFAPRIDLPAGVLTYGIAAADVNGDGKPDLISSSIADQKISVYPNTSTTGNISFATRIDYPSQSSPYRIAINDMDGDGKPDIVVVNSLLASSISVFRNTSTNGNTSFAAKVDFLAGTNPYSLTINDFDGDGKPDVAVGNDLVNTVSVLRNTSTAGSISFASVKDFSAGGSPRGVASGDLDGDGKADLATANYTTFNFSVLRNISTTGNIAFASKKDYDAALNPTSIAIGDLNGDGKADIVVPSLNLAAAENVSTPGNISFTNTTYFYQGLTPNVAGIGDLDGDGINDLAATFFTGQQIRLYRNKNNEPTITRFYPATAKSGDTIYISGHNFTNATSVSFGGIPAASFTVASAELIIAVTSAGTSGAVMVSNAYGSHQMPGFTFVGPPVIDSFSPDSAGQQTPINYHW